jgi:predicted dehydrogenase
MNETKLKTAVLGLDSRGQFLLEAVSKSDHFQILAVADKDATLAESTGYKYKCEHYDDYRQLIMQNQFDCLLVAAGIHSCDEYIKMAMKKKTNILKIAPPARNFQEAAELIRLAEGESIKFAIANPRRFARSYVALREFLQGGGLEQIFFITAFCAVGNEEAGAWQNDPKLAGGGVLLRNCYQMIDQIVWSLGMPQQVYCLNTNTASDRQQRSYLTEDTAVVTMKFSDSFFGNLIVGKVFGPELEVLRVYSKDKILRVSNDRFIISSGPGQMSEAEYDDSERTRYSALLNNFALSILLPDNSKLCSSASDNLNDMAVIEAAYLSARTGMPEEPGRIIKMAQIEPVNIRPAHI